MCGVTFDLPELRSLAEDLPRIDPLDDWQQIAKKVGRNMRRIAKELERGDITPAVWRAKMDSAIRIGHVEAHMAGQRIAGAQGYAGEAQRIGRIIGDGESQYLQGFLNDILDGRYLDLDGTFRTQSVLSRQMMYVNKTRASASTGFVYASSGNQFDWVLGAVEDHCDECPIMAAGGPYTEETLYTVPGLADHPCLTNCRCFLKRDDGVVGPLPFGVTV